MVPEIDKICPEMLKVLDIVELSVCLLNVKWTAGTNIQNGTLELLSPLLTNSMLMSPSLNSFNSECF